MSKDVKPESPADDLKIVCTVRVVDPNQPGAKELHDGQVEIVARHIRRIALERRKRRLPARTRDLRVMRFLEGV
ncbi:MAG TPA: hypothetical protein VFX45_02520 [Solirubrobacterales bacterium]|nr:hypothetical protein [Solirubrobacterales bacterium]